MSNRYPENIMKIVRESCGLEENNRLHDAHLQQLSANEVFERVLNYEGLIHCAGRIKSLVRDIYKVDLDAASAEC